MIKGLKIGIFYLLFVFLMIQSCDTTNYQFTPEQFVALKDSLGKKLVSQCSRTSPRGATQFFNLSESEKNTLHKNFKKIYTLEPEEDAFKDLKITSFDESIFQYVGVIYNDKKYIYINAFPEELIKRTNHDWKRYPVTGCDGGPHFWGVLFDINDERFFDLYMNGPR